VRHVRIVLRLQTDEDGRLVTETLQPLPKDRKCFRLINGVLVERTIEDVLPALNTNSDGLKQVLEELVKQYKGKQSEMDSWKVCWIEHNVATITNDSPEEAQYSGRAELVQWPQHQSVSHYSIVAGLLLAVNGPASPKVLPSEDRGMCHKYFSKEYQC
jgi:chaperonin cofactor prefoldin